MGYKIIERAVVPEVAVDTVSLFGQHVLDVVLPDVFDHPFEVFASSLARRLVVLKCFRYVKTILLGVRPKETFLGVRGVAGLFLFER